MAKGKIYLVDGSGYIFRAFYAVAPLTTSSGFPTNALFGYSRMLLKLLGQSDSNHVVAVFDAGKKTFRSELYAEYKANRSECPEDLLQQMPYFRDITRALGLQVLELPGYEADDIIGTLNTRLRKAGHEVIIVSGDKDLMQLVDEGTTIWDTLKDKHFKPADVKEKWGVPPVQLGELLALTGDSSDNIPGLSGVGPKTAVQLIEKFNDVETILASAALIRAESSIRNRNKIAAQIELEAEAVRLSRKLVQICHDAPVSLRLVGENGEMQSRSIESLDDETLHQSLERRAPDSDALQKLIERFEFGSLFRDLKLMLPEKLANEDPCGAYTTIYLAQFPEFLARLREQPVFALDTETTSLDPLSAKLIGMSFCWSDEEAFYIPLCHRPECVSHDQVPLDEFLSAVRAVLEDPKCEKIGQNLKYDFSVLARQGIEVQGQAFDTMVAAYLLNPDKGAYNLTALTREYLARGVIEYTDIVKEGEDFSFVAIEKATQYCCQDAHFAWLIAQRLKERLATQKLQKVASEIEMPLVKVLSRMELSGIRLDTALLQHMSAEFGAQLESLKVRLYEVAGGEFNINSPKQLSEILFGTLGIPTKGLKKTKTGISTDSSVLEKLRSHHPLPDLILQYRTLHKLKSTYIDTLPSQVSPYTNRLHTSFNQAVTGTGRLSSSDPNLQNIPVQTAAGRRIRNAFVSEPGHCLVSADYSQIELRLLAHMSGDEALIRAFTEGVDIHTQTAREILNVPPLLEVSAEQRRIGKTINFGVIYGMGAYRLSRDLNISIAVASGYIENYFNRFPGVKKFFAEIEAKAEAQGYVETLFGRKRILADIDPSGRDHGFVLRAAMNAPIQGTAADLIKLAMVTLDRAISKERLPMRMLLQIHDELVFECPRAYVEEARSRIREEMENVIPLRIPLKVEVGAGENWQDAH